jgi:RHS repeat-associated protein
VSGGTYDAANRQLTLGGKTMTYDFNGNLATLTESGQTTNYTWDARDRLVALSGPGLSASFAYDATGRRTSKTTAAFATTFQYDDWNTIKEVAGGQAVNYLRGPDPDEHLARIEDTATTCYVPDALASAVVLADAQAGVVTEYTYEPFGQTAATGGSSPNAFQFTGRENDSTGLYYYRLRYYHPGLPRFLGEDPAANDDGANLYSYVENDPIAFNDPFGLQASDPQKPPSFGPPKSGPQNPKRRTHCTKKDTCEELQRKISDLSETLDYHQRWDQKYSGHFNVPPGKHRKEIADFTNAIVNCKQEFDKRCRPQIEACRICAPALLAAAALTVWKLAKFCACSTVGTPALGAACVVTPP